MGAQTKPKRRKCNHDDKESTLILQGDEKKVGKLTMLRTATLIEFCKECETEFNYYVAGGVLFDA
jgi:hypothetical protein